MNVIIIKGLKIDAAVGVTAAERDNPQRLEVDAVITPLQTFAAVADEIGRTVDYQAAAQRIAQLARARPRCLIETLASELAEMLVSEFHAGRAEVEVRKFVLPNTDYVAVRCLRERENARTDGPKRKADRRRRPSDSISNSKAEMNEG
jgi:7,8-dihydroneopterin aldolase/epimerase/oxygenase